MFIDTHCHLNFSVFDPDLTTVLGNAKKAGIKKFIVPGVNFNYSQQAGMLSVRYPDVIYAAAGIHPHEAQELPDANMLIPLITNKTVAIGECGLDYHQYKGHPAVSKKDNQKKLFSDQIALAVKRNLPVIMHCREAFKDLFDVLDSQSSMPRGVIHCFSGGMQEIREAARRKLFIGIDGNVTYSRQLQLIVPQIPLSMLLLETDSPNLTPVPHRGKRNEPKYLRFTANHIALLTSRSISGIETQTTLNAETLFSFS
jgi:TatD DNase family protein